MVTKTCGLCGTGFTCRQEGGCWCADVVVTEERRAVISLMTGGCVCPACLSKP